ncbi:hypothetical protein ACFXI0_29555 [Kitasatospora indigofera]|uniref:hypothetical protein n=1 Tax=Kitasatospora indigofera TaxID=67307 RepID=UPI003676277A
MELLECAAAMLERVGEVEAPLRLTLSVRDRQVVVEAVPRVLGVEVDVDLMAAGTGLAGVGALAEGVFGGVRVRAAAPRLGAVPSRASLARPLDTVAFAGRLRALTGWAAGLGRLRELVLTSDGPIVHGVLRARWATLSTLLDDLAVPDFPPLPFVRPGPIGVEPAAGRFGLRVLPGGDGGDRLGLQRDVDEEVGEAQDDVNISTALLVCALVPADSTEAVELWVPELTGALSMLAPVPQAGPASAGAATEAGTGEGRPGPGPVPVWGAPASGRSTRVGAACWPGGTRTPTSTRPPGPPPRQPSPREGRLRLCWGSGATSRRCRSRGGWAVAARLGAAWP